MTNNPQPLSEEELSAWILETAREHSLYLTIATKSEVIRKLTEELKRERENVAIEKSIRVLAVQQLTEERSARIAIQNAGAMLYANTEGLNLGGRLESARSMFKAECERNK